MQTPSTTTRRVLVLADREPHECDHRTVRAVVEAAGGAAVLLVAPAAALPEETWIADRTARRQAARRRIRAWASLLARHAESIDAEVGDEGAELAVADALPGFPADAIVRTPAGPAVAPARAIAWPLARLRGRLAGAPPVIQFG